MIPPKPPCSPCHHRVTGTPTQAPRLPSTGLSVRQPEPPRHFCCYRIIDKPTEAPRHSCLFSLHRVNPRRFLVIGANLKVFACNNPFLAPLSFSSAASPTLALWPRLIFPSYDSSVPSNFIAFIEHYPERDWKHENHTEPAYTAGIFFPEVARFNLRSPFWDPSMLPTTVLSLSFTAPHQLSKLPPAPYHLFP